MYIRLDMVEIQVQQTKSRLNNLEEKKQSKIRPELVSMMDESRLIRLVPSEGQVSKNVHNTHEKSVNQ